MARVIIGDSARAVGLGLVAGLLLSGLARKGIGALLVDAAASDGSIVAAVIVLMGVLAVAAAAVPARRASRVDPVETLNR